MTISEVVAILQKANQIAGDIPVAVKAVEDGAESTLLALNIHLPATEGEPAAVQLVHGPAPASPAEGQAGSSDAPPAA